MAPTSKPSKPARPALGSGGAALRAAGGAARAAKPTLKTISHLSGLAVPTVSRALSDAPDIGAGTKALVRRIAQEIGYVPNRAGVRLRTGRTNVVSLVMSTEQDMMNHTARLISSVAGALQNTPFHLIVTPYFPDEDPMKPVLYLVETGSADAVIFNQTEPEDPRVAYLMERGFPFATHGRSNWCADHAYFDYDNAAFGRIALRRMIARGRRHVVLVAPPRAQNYAQNMIEGATAGAAGTGCRLTVSDRVTSDAGSAAVRAAMVETLREDPGVDGIVCASTSAAMASVAALEDMGRVVGGDIDIFAKEAIPFLNLFRPGIMTLNEDVGRAGDFLARAAIQAVRDPRLPPMQGLEVPQDEAEDPVGPGAPDVAGAAGPRPWAGTQGPSGAGRRGPAGAGVQGPGARSGAPHAEGPASEGAPSEGAPGAGAEGPASDPTATAAPAPARRSGPTGQ